MKDIGCITSLSNTSFGENYINKGIHKMDDDLPSNKGCVDSGVCKSLENRAVGEAEAADGVKVNIEDIGETAAAGAVCTATDEDATQSQGESSTRHSQSQSHASEDGAGRGADIDVADESSSMNRVLAWDPWAGLALMKSEGLAAPALGPAASTPAPSACDTAHVASILKGSARRASSACESSAVSFAGGSRFEPLPIGDAPAPSPSPGHAFAPAADKHVQWHHEVEVTYYTFDSDGRAVLTTHVEPLHEEGEQLARAHAKALVATHARSLDEWLPDLHLGK